MSTYFALLESKKVAHKCKFVKQKAAELDIYPVYLPPYSPQLNPIEYIWIKYKKRLSLVFVKNYADNYNSVVVQGRFNGWHARHSDWSAGSFGIHRGARRTVACGGDLIDFNSQMSPTILNGSCLLQLFALLKKLLVIEHGTIYIFFTYAPSWTYLTKTE